MLCEIYDKFQVKILSFTIFLIIIYVLPIYAVVINSSTIQATCS